MTTVPVSAPAPAASVTEGITGQYAMYILAVILLIVIGFFLYKRYFSAPPSTYMTSAPAPSRAKEEPEVEEGDDDEKED
jgi:hypothetical protein